MAVDRLPKLNRWSLKIGRPLKDRLDLTDPVHVALALMVVLLVVAILLVSLTETDTDVVSSELVALMLGACLVVGTRTK